MVYLAKLSGIFWALNMRKWEKNEIWNDPMILIILSAHRSIYYKVEDYETENKMHIEYEWEKKFQVKSQFQVHLVTKSHSRQELD